MTLFELSAAEAISKLRNGEITSEELVHACLNRIEEVDAEIHAWTHLNPDYALEQARELDVRRQGGGPLGPLHGIPIGIKDICDTSTLPTENGTVLDSGRQPNEDCRVVSLLREAGAVVMGKTVTTELAAYGPGKTRNPHNPEHTPGGSSSGSAAAVAAHMVPLAIGTQTNGSVIRPASYCGVVGFKPTHGLIPRTGVLVQSAPLDTVGTFARSIEDIALLTEILVAYDPRDRHTRPRAQPPLIETASQEPPLTPVLAFCRTAFWDQAENEMQEAFAELVEILGDDCHEVSLNEPLEHTIEMHGNIMCADLAKNLAGYYERGKDKMTDTLCKMIEFGKNVSAVDYNKAVEGRDFLNSSLNSVFDHYDVIITPAATGEAPLGIDSTGNPVFNTLATYCGTPSITLPLMEGPKGLPLGIQVIGPRYDDARLLRTANWLTLRLAED